MSSIDGFRLIQIGVIGIYFAASVGWIWLWFGIGKGGWRGSAGAVAIQLSMVGYAYDGLFRRDVLGALLSVAFPPALLFEVPKLLAFQPFLAEVLPTALGAGAVVLVGFMLRPKYLLSSIGPVLMTIMGVGLIVGEGVSKSAMCRQALGDGLIPFRRHSLTWSLANAPQEFQFDIHAAAEKGAKRFGWSYREMGWYEIPQDAGGDVDEPRFWCFS